MIASFYSWHKSILYYITPQRSWGAQGHRAMERYKHESYWQSLEKHPPDWWDSLTSMYWGTTYSGKMEPQILAFRNSGFWKGSFSYCWHLHSVIWKSKILVNAESTQFTFWMYQVQPHPLLANFFFFLLCKY